MAVERVEKLQRAVECIAQRGIDPIGVSAWPIVVLVTLDDFRRMFKGRVVKRENYSGSWRWSGTMDGCELVAYEEMPAESPVEMEVA